MKPLGVLCRVLCLSLVQASSTIKQFTASPSVIRPGITDTLTLRCPVFTPKAHDVDSFSISQVKGEDKTPIAKVTSEGAKALYNSPDITVNGLIPTSNDDTDNAFLEVTWKYPGANQSGVYECIMGAVHYTTKGLHIHFNLNMQVKVSEEDASLSDVIGYMHQLKLTSDHQACTIDSLQQDNDLHISTIDLLKSTIANQSQAISELQQKNSDKDKQLAEIKQKQNTAVMFSAYLDRFVKLYHDDVVIFNRIVTNVGGHYKPSTGVFTCPVSGYYVFDVHVQGQEDQTAAVEIRLNGGQLVRALAEDNLDNQSVSAHVTVMLRQGDKVDVAVYNRRSYLAGGKYRFCMFSGHLVNLL